MKNSSVRPICMYNVYALRKKIQKLKTFDDLVDASYLDHLNVN